MGKALLQTKSRAEPTFFFMAKTTFSLKLSLGYFYGQSLIKTARGPSVVVYSCPDLQIYSVISLTPSKVCSYFLQSYSLSHNKFTSSVLTFSKFVEILFSNFEISSSKFFSCCFYFSFFFLELYFMLYPCIPNSIISRSN